MKNSLHNGSAPVHGPLVAGRRNTEVRARDLRPAEIRSVGNPRRELQQHGFVSLGAEQLNVPQRLSGSLDDFANAYQRLPHDTYSGCGGRLRCHQRFILLSEPLRVIPTSVSTYSQSKSLNSEDGGTLRQFAALPRGLDESRFLHSLIRFDFEHSPFEGRWKNAVFDVGVHMIRLRPKPGRPAMSSPNELHKDGEPVTWIHLISRDGVTGGESLVADNRKKPLFQATLKRRLDTLAVWDESVYHHVYPVEVEPGQNEGYRDVLLIDFSPMLPITDLQAS